MLIQLLVPLIRLLGYSTTILWIWRDMLVSITLIIDTVVSQLQQDGNIDGIALSKEAISQGPEQADNFQEKEMFRRRWTGSSRKVSLHQA